jgi:hypothetical protein
MLAVIGFDLANETILKAVAVELNNTIKLKRYFNEVIEQINAELGKKGKPQLNTTNIGKVHDIRNATQHHARYPTEIELNDCRTYTRDFLEKTL